MTLKLIEVLKMPKYSAIAALSAIIFAFVYMYAQVLGNIDNIIIWIQLIPWYNVVFFIMLAAVFGITMSFQIYTWKQPKTCNVKKTTSASSIAAFAGFFVAQCPACASLSALFLPVSAVAFLTTVSAVINLIIIAVMLLAINYLGGFKQIKSVRLQ